MAGKQADQSIEDVAGFISSSTHRQKVVAALSEGSKTVKQIARETEMYVSHVSNTLRSLEERNLAKCTTPDRKKGRLYKLTEEGGNVIREISIPERYFPGALELEVGKLFDELSIPYAKNEKLEAGNIEFTPDFVIMENFSPKAIFEVKRFHSPSKLKGSLERFAFRASELKKETKNLKVVLVLGGLKKADLVESDASGFIKGDYFDAILHESDLDSLRKRGLTLGEILNVEKYLGKWPEEKKAWCVDE